MGWDESTNVLHGWIFTVADVRPEFPTPIKRLYATWMLHCFWWFFIRIYIMWQIKCSWLPTSALDMDYIHNIIIKPNWRYMVLAIYIYRSHTYVYIYIDMHTWHYYCPAESLWCTNPYNHHHVCCDVGQWSRYYLVWLTSRIYMCTYICKSLRQYIHSLTMYY